MSRVTDYRSSQKAVVINIARNSRKVSATKRTPDIQLPLAKYFLAMNKRVRYVIIDQRSLQQNLCPMISCCKIAPDSLSAQYVKGLTFLELVCCSRSIFVIGWHRHVRKKTWVNQSAYEHAAM